MKFRVWSPRHQRYFNDNFLMSGDGNLYEYIAGKLERRSLKFYWPEFLTGIIDSVGTEIYEGDIIKVTWTIYTDVVPATCTQTGAVVWDEYYLQWQYNGMDCALNDLDTIVVIGNIHQNPDLLGEK